MRGYLVGEPLIPAHARDPRRRLIEGALRHGQWSVMAVNVQLAADRAYDFAHMF
jgi:hypothetical protein